MSNLSTKITEYAKSKNIENIDFSKDVILQDNSDGKGPFISKWNLKIVKPTLKELESFEDLANKAEANIKIDHDRMSEYGDWKTQLDQIYHDMDGWKARIKSVKDKYPKP